MVNWIQGVELMNGDLEVFGLRQRINNMADIGGGNKRKFLYISSMPHTHTQDPGWCSGGVYLRLPSAGSCV